MDEELVAILLFVTIPTILFFTVVHRWLKMKERRLELEAEQAKTARHQGKGDRELEQRVRVLEQIVVDSGAQTASQIDALRSLPRMESEPDR
ncbi:hypothetical protein [Sphingomicrobium lutaoense]|uniref:Phage shock protein B n=1 Tax=Sphingomicrobium lutaoense TaxID=515949 RepID=A0A839YX88_9SPHN|nr:hypothetical protein [Sphingomicrobium lutaoense]MBB3763656.1 hypothetical protein [Sphingomicrobium lutaoense]